MGAYIQRDSFLVGEPTLRELSASVADFVDLTVSTNSSSTNVFPFWVTAPGTPGLTSWPSGSYGAQINVIAAGSSVTYGMFLQRRNSTLSSILTTLASNSSQSGTGLKSISGSVGSAISASASDRLMLVVNTANSNMMAAEDLTLRVNTTDSYVEVPWTVSGGEPETPHGEFTLLDVSTLAATGARASQGHAELLDVALLDAVGSRTSAGTAALTDVSLVEWTGATPPDDPVPQGVFALVDTSVLDTQGWRGSVGTVTVTDTTLLTASGSRASTGSAALVDSTIVVWTGAAGDVLLPPANLEATPVSTSRVDLSWEPV